MMKEEEGRKEGRRRKKKEGRKEKEEQGRKVECKKKNEEKERLGG